MMKRIALSGLFFLAVAGGAHAQATSAAVVTTCNTQSYVVGQYYPLTQTAGGVLCDTGGGGGGGGTVTANQGTAAPVTGGWPVINGEPADTTGTFTNATQSGNVTSATVDGYETATISINGTYGTATATFVASDDGGTTYYPIQCARSDGTALEGGYTSLTNTNRAWFCPIHSFDTVRVLSSAVASGTVNVRISISSSPTAAGVLEGVSGTVTIATNQSVNVAQVNGTTTLTGTGAQGTGAQRVTVATDSATVAGSATLPAGTNTIGGTTPVSATTGGLTMSSTLIASGTNATNVKASAGQIYHLTVTNNSTAIGYLKLYNSASAPTAGSGTPVWRVMIPGNTNGAGVVTDVALGLTFSSGIGFTFTGGIADADTTSVAASQFIVNIGYK